MALLFLRSGHNFISVQSAVKIDEQMCLQTREEQKKKSRFLDKSLMFECIDQNVVKHTPAANQVILNRKNRIKMVFIPIYKCNTENFNHNLQ